MLDKIMKINNHQAYMIYDDGRIVSLYSGTDVNEIIMIIVSPFNYDMDMQTYCRSLDDTVSINLNKVG